MRCTKLAEFFKEEFFIPSLSSKKRSDVLLELIQPLLEHGIVRSQSLVLEILEKRETLGSTGIGKGVAIPHCRTLAVSDIHVVVGISKMGIPYHAIDKKDVHIFFLILAPPQDDSNCYLPVLGKLVEIVREPKRRKALLKSEIFSDFIGVILGG